MSGQFTQFGAERVKEKEQLLVREELQEILQPSKKVFSYTIQNSKRKPLLDYYNNTNLLLTNPIKEKEDNGDIDIFLIYENDEKQKFVEILKNHKNVIIYNSENKEVHSFLFYSEKIKKKVQIDLNFINENSVSELNNYFKYFQAPYFFYTLSYLIKSFKEKLNIKISNKGVFIKLDNSEIVLEKNLNSFLYYFFNIEDLSYFDSYEKIGKFLSEQGFHKSLLEGGKVLSKRTQMSTTENEKFGKIISYLNGDTKDTELLLKKFKENFPFIDDKIKGHYKEQEKIKNEKENRVKNLEYLFGKSLSKLDNEEKILVGNYGIIHNELAKLKKMQEILGEKELFLVGGCVRDIILKKQPNDFDLTGTIHSKEIQEKFGGTINEKYGTTFLDFEDLEIEYTPFRNDEKYNGRQAEVSFNATIEEDSVRRDFTFNSLYISLKTGKIIDLHGGVNDLKNKVLKSIGDPIKRFNEDYLRILRGIRLSIKLGLRIEENTKKTMLEEFKNLNKISIERLIEELDKGLLLNDFSYIELLEDFFMYNYSVSVIELWKKKINFISFIRQVVEVIVNKKITDEELTTKLSLTKNNFKIYFLSKKIEKPFIQNKKDLFLFILYKLPRKYVNYDDFSKIRKILKNLEDIHSIKLINLYNSLIEENITFNEKIMREELDLSIIDFTNIHKIREETIEKYIKYKF